MQGFRARSSRLCQASPSMGVSACGGVHERWMGVMGLCLVKPADTNNINLTQIARMQGPIHHDCIYRLHSLNNRS
jgi:hypothetical protein